MKALMIVLLLSTPVFGASYDRIEKDIRYLREEYETQEPLQRLYEMNRRLEQERIIQQQEEILKRLRRMEEDRKPDLFR